MGSLYVFAYLLHFLFITITIHKWLMGLFLSEVVFAALFLAETQSCGN